MADTNSKPTADELKYEHYEWGEVITGSKAQLQAIGIAPGKQFPGEMGAPKCKLKGTDPRGFPFLLRADGQGYQVWIDLPGREREYEQEIEYAPGVTIRRMDWGDLYEGSGPDLVKAGIVKDEHLPGAPGMPKTTAYVFPDGTVWNKDLGAKPDGEGAIRIFRESKSKYAVSVSVSTAESQSRLEAMKCARREWETRVASMPRPAPLCLGKHIYHCRVQQQRTQRPLARDSDHVDAYRAYSLVDRATKALDDFRAVIDVASDGFAYTPESEGRILRLIGELRRAVAEANLRPANPRYRSEGNVTFLSSCAMD